MWVKISGFSKWEKVVSDDKNLKLLPTSLKRDKKWPKNGKNHYMAKILNRGSMEGSEKS